ncbi:MAG: polyprenyl synthetase family protein [Micropruina sp.]
MVSFDARNPVSPEFRRAVGDRIDALLTSQEPVLAGIGADVTPLLTLAREFTGGGKRLRPAFCYWGQVAITGQSEDPTPLLAAAASLDLLHVSALVHDDVMDASDTRRGVPAVHRQFETQHTQGGWRGDPTGFGRAGAILLGDLLLIWSAEMLDTSGLSPEALRRAAPLVAAVRTEVTCGQFLDVLAQATPLGSADQPLSSAAALALLEEVERVVEYKTARYTVVRPTQIGAAIGGATPAQLDDLARFASPLGRAFQYRDDLLGVFGDSAVTGKPAGDDLREGKLNVLTANALANADRAAAGELVGLLGRSDLTPADVERARQIIVDTGALTAAEAAIARHHEQSLAALKQADITEEGRIALTRLAELAVSREA